MIKSQISISKVVLVTFFLISLVIPNLVMVLGVEKAENNENRKFEELPDFSLKQPQKSISNFKNYYVENYGLKATLVNTYIDLKNGVFKENPIPSRVVKGRNGWYFMGNESTENGIDSDHGINAAFGIRKLTHVQKEIILRNLQEVQNFCKSEGIAFYIVVPPNKGRIYKEQLPYQLQQQTTKLEDLCQYLKTHSNLNIIDLYKAILDASQNQQLYFKTDTHWNDLGAYFGYLTTIDVLNEAFDIPKVPLSNYNMNERVSKNGDIINMINLKIEENSVFTDGMKADSMVSKSQLKVRLCHDSFGNAWKDYFEDTFENIEFSRSYLIDKTSIKVGKPDIIIFEIVERYMDDVLINQKKPLLVR